MRTLPLLMLTLALSCAEQAPADTGQKDWRRPIDREPVDDWSERTGVPSPFPCRADMVWCEAAKTDRKNPDGTDHGAWVPSTAWVANAAPPPRVVDGVIGSYLLEATANEVVGVLASQYIEARVVPADDRFAVYTKVKVPHEATAAVDHAPLREAAEQLAAAVGEATADGVIDEQSPFVDALIAAYDDHEDARRLAVALGANGVEARVVTDLDGAAFGVFASVQVAGAPASDGGPFPEPREGEPLWAYVARLSREERFLVWPDGPDGEPAHPLDVYRRVDSEGGRVATFVLAPPTAAPDLQADDSH